MHTNTADAAVPEKKKKIDQDTIPTKPTETIDSSRNADMSNNKASHASQYENPLQLYPEIK